MQTKQKCGGFVLEILVIVSLSEAFVSIIWKCDYIIQNVHYIS